MGMITEVIELLGEQVQECDGDEDIASVCKDMDSEL